MLHKHFTTFTTKTGNLNYNNVYFALFEVKKNIYTTGCDSEIENRLYNAIN